MSDADDGCIILPSVSVEYCVYRLLDRGIDECGGSADVIIINEDKKININASRELII